MHVSRPDQISVYKCRVYDIDLANLVKITKLKTREFYFMPVEIGILIANNREEKL